MCLIYSFGAIIPINATWTITDITIGLMTLINFLCVSLGKIAINCLNTMKNKEKMKKNPIFKAKNIDLDETLL